MPYLDTNVLLSAFWSATGASHQILRELLAGKWTALIENHLVTEYAEPVLQLAFEARVPYISTSNGRDFRGAESFGIQVVSPAAFLKIIRSHP